MKAQSTTALVRIENNVIPPANKAEIIEALTQRKLQLMREKLEAWEKQQQSLSDKAQALIRESLGDLSPLEVNIDGPCKYGHKFPTVRITLKLSSLKSEAIVAAKQLMAMDSSRPQVQSEERIREQVKSQLRCNPERVKLLLQDTDTLDRVLSMINK